jgi:1-deoxy-D-xylulose-5-phosphate reductoisomerase
MLIHDTNMTIPIFNSIYSNNEKKIKSNNLNLSIINNLRFDRVDRKRFPIIKLLDKLPEKDSLYETIIVSANDTLVQLFLNKKIKFTDISKKLLKIIMQDEFTRYKYIKPKNVEQILQLNNYVSLKTATLCV